MRTRLVLPAPGADVDLVRAWRVPEDAPFLWMRGVTTSYRADPVAEYIIGMAGGRAYHPGAIRPVDRTCVVTGQVMARLRGRPGPPARSPVPRGAGAAW